MLRLFKRCCYCTRKVGAFVNYLVRGSLSSPSNDLLIAFEDVLEVGGRLQLVACDDLEQAQDVSHPGEVHSLLAREVLDDLQLPDVALGVPAPVGGGAKRLHQA